MAAAANICIRDTGTAKGRGIFALTPFAPDELVEACPVVIMRTAFRGLPDELKTLVFNWGFLTGGPDMHAVALGHGSLYNHENPSNLRYLADAEAQLLRFVAVRPIAADEELTINYNAHGGGHVWHDNKWFERLNVPLIEGHTSEPKR
jgi:hypothetical protein